MVPRITLLSFFTALLLSAPALAKDAPPEVKVNASLRPRAEVDHRKGQQADFFVTNQARLSAGATQGSWGVYVQPQDVRYFGSEADTISLDGSLSLHQGWVEHKNGKLYSLRAGRQEINYLNERLIGAVGWTQVGRSFDGVRASGEYKRIAWDTFAAVTSQATGKENRDAGVAAWLVKWSNLGRTVAGVAVYQFNPQTKDYRWTGGPYSAGKIIGPLSYEAEAYMQQGHDPKKTPKKAYFASAQLKGTYDIFRCGVGHDLVSGDTKDEDTVAFNTLYATNHKFYGFMDMFTNLPAHTQNAGLRDSYASAGVKKGRWDLGVTGHRFRTAGNRVVVNPATKAAKRFNEKVWGTEWDTIATWTASKHVSVQAGYTVLLPGEAFENAFPKAPEYPNWSYLMVTAAM